MGLVYKQVLRFKKKYGMSIGWRIKAHTSIVEKHLNPDAIVGEYTYKALTE